PAFTDFAGLYQRATEHDNRPPFDLPKRWLEKKTSLNLSTKFDFVSDADIIGGNSGSPVVNKANEFVGIIFDGNIQSLAADCIYTDTQARAVSVDSAAIVEALRKVYDAGALADEIESAKKKVEQFKRVSIYSSTSARKDRNTMAAASTASSSVPRLRRVLSCRLRELPGWTAHLNA